MSLPHDDAQWPRASAWMSDVPADDPQARLCRLQVAGVPINRSVTPGHCDQAPAAIREALRRFSLWDFAQRQALPERLVVDHGDLPVDATNLEASVTSLQKLSPIGKWILLGGDNGVTRPGALALARRHGFELPRVGILTLDAHLDVRHLNDGPHNGNPIRGLIEDGVRGRNVVQLGLQSFANSPDYAAWAKEQGMEPITMDALTDFEKRFSDELASLAARVDVIYFNLDLDVLDAAFAPACPGARPGGLTPLQIRHAARMAGVHPKVRAMDLVEIDPTRDPAGITALAAAACFMEFAAGTAVSDF